MAEIDFRDPTSTDGERDELFDDLLAKQGDYRTERTPVFRNLRKGILPADTKRAGRSWNPIELMELMPGLRGISQSFRSPLWTLLSASAWNQVENKILVELSCKRLGLVRICRPFSGNWIGYVARHDKDRAGSMPSFGIPIEYLISRDVHPFDSLAVAGALFREAAMEHNFGLALDYGAVVQMAIQNIVALPFVAKPHRDRSEDPPLADDFALMAQEDILHSSKRAADRLEFAVFVRQSDPLIAQFLGEPELEKIARSGRASLWAG